MAHEYTPRRSPIAARPSARPAAADEEGWLDEALAHLAEDLHGFSRSNLDYRVGAFLAAPERFRLVVGDYAASDLFRSPRPPRAAPTLPPMVLPTTTGPGLAERSILSDLRGVPNLESATGRSFASLYRGWSVAAFLDAIDRPAEADSPAVRALGPGGRGPRRPWTGRPAIT